MLNDGQVRLGDSGVMGEAKNEKGREGLMSKRAKPRERKSDANGFESFWRYRFGGKVGKVGS